MICIDEFLIVSDLVSTCVGEFVRGLDRLLPKHCQSRAGEDFEEHCDVAPGCEIGPIQGPCGDGLILSSERMPVLFEGLQLLRYGGSHISCFGFGFDVYINFCLCYKVYL